MKIDLVKLVEEVYKLEGEPKNVNKVFALICLQAFKEQLTLTDVSQQRELLIAFAKYMEEDKMYARHDEANVNDFLDSHSN